MAFQNAPMKILLDARAVRPPISGSAQYAINLALNLTNHIDESSSCDLLASSFFGSNSAFHDVFANYKSGQLIFNPYAPRKLQSLFLDLLGYNPGFYNKKSYNVVHETFLGTLPCRNDVQKVSTLLDLIPFDRPELFPARVRLIFQKAIRRQINTSNHFIAISEYTKQRFLSYSGVDSSRVSVIPCGIKEIKERQVQLPNELDQTDYILYVGNIEPRKNLITLAKAIAEVAESLPRDLKVVIAGKPCWNYEEQISTLKKLVQERVIFLGFVDEDVKWRLLRSAKCLVYPSEYEGFGIPIIEAMRARTPVLFADNSSMSELAVCPNQMFSTYDYMSLGEKILQVLDDDDWVSPSVSKSYSESLQYNWNSVASATVDIYKQLVNS